jgi:hypothetical protein
VFNPVGEFDQRSGPERAERKVPCGRCRAYIILKPPVEGACYACWAGHPPTTRPWRDFTAHPYYQQVLAREMARRPVVEEAA